LKEYKDTFKFYILKIKVNNSSSSLGFGTTVFSLSCV